MENKNPSSEEIRKKREFAYRAYSPDSEPPSPAHDDQHEDTGLAKQEERAKEDRTHGEKRQSA
jgi:hypothetical protein